MTTQSIKMLREDIEKVIELMRSQSPTHHFEFHDPYWVLITTMLSHRTKDPVTDDAARKLKARYIDMNGLAEASYEDVLKIIEKVGFRKAKAQRIIDASRILIEKYGGNVPPSLEELTTIPGVGRKTANVVLSDSFNIPAIAVDTHVQRICVRLGISRSDDPAETEKVLMEIVPRELWVGLNPMMVEFGKTVCRPVGPRCEKCLIREYCEYDLKNKEKNGTNNP